MTLRVGALCGHPELASRVLAELGVEPAIVRQRVADWLGTGTPRPTGTLGVAPQTKRLLELARMTARLLGRPCPNTERVLLAATSPKLHSPAATLLFECGASVVAVRDQLNQILRR